MEPFFSVIIVCRNSGELMKGTIESALSQSFNNYEIIVKDGLSTDNTLSFVPTDERIKITSEKDNGVYDGMNKAVELSSGKWLIFMNCGDSFYDKDVLKNVYNSVKETDEIVYGNYSLDGKETKQDEKIDYKHLMFKGGLCHQSMFVRRDIHIKLGNYDTSYKICADFDFIFKAYKANVKYRHLNIVICQYLGGGMSDSGDGIGICINEGKEIKKKYAGKVGYLVHLGKKAAKKIFK